MPSPAAPSRLTVDLDALAANWRVLRAEAAGAEVAAVVKADGYGMGAAEVAARLWAEGARSFFTARVAGGVALRRSLGPDRPATIYVLDGCPEAAAPALLASGLTPVLNSLEQIAHWRADGLGRPCALHIDTGMNRLGLSMAETRALDRQGLNLILVMSHLACGPDPSQPLNRRQAERFAEMRALFPEVRASLANSSGAFMGPDFRFDMVRPGISLYGGGPQDRPDPRLKAVATFEAQILQVRDVAAGESVGYGARFVAEEPRRVAVVGVGYADGVLRSAWPGGGAWFEGDVRPFAGRLSMDLATIDVTGCDAARPGRWVELFGPNLMIDDAASAWGTLALELLTRIGPRAERIYLSR
ncbi:MAG: alanine racemase [Proteobacteria bacterium]|nr:alanine racemase [Pseudomonadota bacterium]